MKLVRGEKGLSVLVLGQGDVKIQEFQFESLLKWLFFKTNF